MPGLVPGICVFSSFLVFFLSWAPRRGWLGQARPWRSDGL